jgi:hypothetical protein
MDLVQENTGPYWLGAYRLIGSPSANTDDMSGGEKRASFSGLTSETISQGETLVIVQEAHGIRLTATV